MAVGAEDLQVLQPVVMAVTVDVMQCEGDRLFVPFRQAAGLATAGLDSGGE